MQTKHFNNIAVFLINVTLEYRVRHFLVRYFQSTSYRHSGSVLAAFYTARWGNNDYNSGCPRPLYD